jgi:hypothetical protein
VKLGAHRAQLTELRMNQPIPEAVGIILFVCFFIYDLILNLN